MLVGAHGCAPPMGLFPTGRGNPCGCPVPRFRQGAPARRAHGCAPLRDCSRLVGATLVVALFPVSARGVRKKGARLCAPTGLFSAGRGNPRGCPVPRFRQGAPARRAHSCAPLRILHSPSFLPARDMPGYWTLSPVPSGRILMSTMGAIFSLNRSIMASLLSAS